MNCPDDGNVCNGVESCDPLTGNCVPGTNAPTGTLCDDGIPCTTNDQCNGSGVCTGTSVVCPNDGNFCNGVESCDKSDGKCKSSGNPCTSPLLCCKASGSCEKDPDKDGLGGKCDNCPTIWNPSQANSGGDKRGDACALGVCFDAENFGINALCVENCGAGNATNCKTVCDYFGIEYKSPKQCRNAGSAKTKKCGKAVVGNNECKRDMPLNPPKRWQCCKCDKM